MKIQKTPDSQIDLEKKETNTKLEELGLLT